MKKKRIDVGELEFGMYIAELDRPWLGTPFLFQGFTLTSQEDMAKLRTLCKYVYVDEEVFPLPQQARKVPVKPAPVASLRPQSDLPSTNAPPQIYPDVTSVEEELQQLIDIERAARETVFTIFEEARLGRTPNVSQAKELVNELVESAIRNPDALHWVSQIKHKHEYTATHSLRVCMLALTFGRYLGFPREKLNLLGIGSMLHDVGKLRIPNELLDLPRALTPKEMEIMKTHVPLGYKLLQGDKHMPHESLDVIARHHERYDGNGYIAGISGDAIGEFGNITRIVDEYDAITSDRAYRAGLSNNDALSVIYQKRGADFHPLLAEHFIQCMGVYPIGSIVEMANGDIGIVITNNRLRRLRPRVTLLRNRDGVPYSPVKDVDLMFAADPSGRPYEIRKMLPAGAFGINPAEYIPVQYKAA